MVAGVTRPTRFINNDYMMTSYDVTEDHVIHSHNSFHHCHSTSSAKRNSSTAKNMAVKKGHISVVDLDGFLGF